MNAISTLNDAQTVIAGNRTGQKKRWRKLRELKKQKKNSSQTETKKQTDMLSLGLKGSTEDLD